jgi:two-component system nitrogen regulation sensor histidine kinase NtrY
VEGSEDRFGQRRAQLKLHGYTTPSSTGLLILVLFYILLIGLILVFAGQLIANISETGSFANTLAIVTITFVLPIVLLIAIVYNVVKLIRERTRRRAGSKLKTRLLAFFTLIALLSLIPQALLSIMFINSAINFWFSTKVGEAMEGGLNLSLEYRISKVENLKRFSTSPLLSGFLDGIEREPHKVWETIQNANPEITLLQIFDQEGKEIIFQGNEEGRVRNTASLSRLQSSVPTIEVSGDVTILRTLARPTIDGRGYSVILGIVYPKKFDEYASVITEARSHFKQLFRYEKLFRIAVVIFYFLCSSPILLLSILVSFLLTDEIIRPIVNLEEATRRISEGDFSFRVLTRTKDELSFLVASFNRMISELEGSRKKLLQAEKIAAWQEIAQRLAHEVKNPLTPIKLSAQRILKRYRTNPESLEGVLEPAVSSIIDEVDNLNKLLVEFGEFTRLPNPHSEPVDMRQLIQEVIHVYEHLSNRVTFSCRFVTDKVTIRVDRKQMKQVFANLIKNAIQAMSNGGELSVTTDLVKKDENQYFRVQVRDTGDGIDEEIKDKIFEPYFTTKRDGSGLGLSIVDRIIFDHNGSIWFETKKGSGTTFFIDLPMEN